MIVSLATSSPEDLPRHVDFFYLKTDSMSPLAGRQYVATRRARTLAIVLMNPRLLDLDARLVEHCKW